MPHNTVDDVIGFLLAKEHLTQEDWFTFVELRKRYLVHLIKKFGQTELKYVWHGHGAPESNPGVTVGQNVKSFSSDDSKITLETRGIFIYDEKSYRRGREQQDLLIYGLLRSGKWVKVVVSFSATDKQAITDGHVIVAGYTDLRTLISEYRFLTYRRIFEALGKVVDEYVDDRKRFLREAIEIQQLVHTENQLVTRRCGKDTDNAPFAGEFQKGDIVVCTHGDPHGPTGPKNPKEPLRVAWAGILQYGGSSQQVEVVDADGARIEGQYSCSCFKLLQGSASK